MSRIKMILELSAPEVMRRKSDGTVAKEMLEQGPFRCPCCNGSGWTRVDYSHGKPETEQCEMCLGYGELKAEITVEWKPSPNENPRP